MLAHGARRLTMAVHTNACVQAFVEELVKKLPRDEYAPHTSAVAAPPASPLHAHGLHALHAAAQQQPTSVHALHTIAPGTPAVAGSGGGAPQLHALHSGSLQGVQASAAAAAAAAAGLGGGSSSLSPSVSPAVWQQLHALSPLAAPSITRSDVQVRQVAAPLSSPPCAPLVGTACVP